MKNFFSKIVNEFFGVSYKDPIQAHPQLGPLVAAYERMDGRQAEAMFKSSRGQWDFYTQVIDLTAERYFMALQESTREQMIDFYVKRKEVAWLIARGVWHMVEGWEARGGGRASTVTQEGFTELERRCRLAKKDLLEAAAQDAENPAPYTFLLRAARGLSDRSLGEEAYAQAIARDAYGYEPHRAFLRLVSQRWMGSHEEMLEQARHIASNAPEGTDAASLVIEAHYDHYSYICRFDESVALACAFLRDRDILDEVSQALSRSVDAPGYQLSPSTFYIRHLAAVLFWQAGETDAARAQLAKVGNVFCIQPWWQHTPQPEEFYTEVRKKLGLS